MNDTQIPFTHPTVHEQVSKVMEGVQGISKKSRNTTQNFNFRGIDAVMNAVGPQLREHGVIVSPSQVDVLDYEHYTTKSGTAMVNVRVKVTYTWFGPGGDSFRSCAVGEASDSGDKATQKAMSVSFRTMLLQTLCIPTDEPDPDSVVYERGASKPQMVSRTTGALSQPVEAPVSHAEPHPVGEDVEAFLQGLREARQLAEPAEKLARVGALKARYKDLLQTPTTMKDGSTVTLGRLSDTIATDALVSGSS